MAENTQLDVLAIAAHPDDAEITCGGLLIKMARKGHCTGILDLTQGEMGTYGDEHDRKGEADDAAKIMGLSYRHNLKLPDSAVEPDRASKLKVAQVLRETRPELVVLPHWEQRHPDHLACCRLGYDACFLAGLAKLELKGEPFRPHKIIYAAYSRAEGYSFLVDISEQIETKILAVAAYKSQFGEFTGLSDSDSEAHRRDIFAPGVSIFDFIHTRARYYGQRAGVAFAEAYTIKESILIDDPFEMKVRSL
ncbi:MAG: bacillithiol biosynthesis deacetylase BshB1 [Candidatus Zixiibacteriota bacterium]|nr:MAG: bacillithiol biosynthesis deacetylase BshB1 [candidate division Zixibacteria bacterium]